MYSLFRIINSLNKEILIGRNVLLKSETKAISNCTGVTFTLDDSNKMSNTLDVEMVDVERVKPIQEADIKCENLDLETKEQLISLLNKYRKTVSFNIKELGKTSATEMKIELMSDTPVLHAPYRLSLSDRKIVKEILEELEEHNIIR